MKLRIPATIFLLALCSLVAGQSGGLYSPADGVVELTPVDFESRVMQDNAIWIVQFYANWCSHCHTLVPEYRKLARALRGIIKLAAINGARHTELSSSFGIRGFPVILIFGADKKKPIELPGPRTANNIAETALEMLTAQIKKELGGAGDTGSDVQSICFDSDVIELEGEHFNKQVLNSDETWLVEFYTPSCPQCKSLAPEWITVAEQLKGRIKVGAIDGSEYAHLAREYKVRDYPTILYFPAKTRQPAHALEYKKRQRSAAEIVEWANSMTLAQMPTVPLRQIVSEASLIRDCSNKPWCMIALLPTLHGCNARCRNQLLERLRRLGGKYREQGWGWVWTEAGQQRPLEQSMRVSSYPTLAVVNCGKMKIGLFSAEFDEAGLDAYLDAIARGRAKLGSLSCAKIPPIRNVQAWNGLDASPHPEARFGEHLLGDEL